MRPSMIALFAVLVASSALAASEARASGRPPNIVFVLADDLGIGELGCYGQELIRTPNVDRLAREGVRFTQHYSGHCVCAPSRCVLLTGRHTGRSWIRGNSAWASSKNEHGEGQEPLPTGTPTVARMLQGRGYATACIGKWGLGGPGTSGRPNAQGFDRFFGYLCQKQAHDYYPAHLWRNERKVLLSNPGFTPSRKWKSPPEDLAAYDAFSGDDYAPELMIDEALGFVRSNAERPFFLYYATPVPHAGLQVPVDSLGEYTDRGWDAEPYLGGKGYVPHPAPRAAYAAMVTRLDRDVGRILALLEELELQDDTLVVFSSDNGPTYNGGTDSAFFDSCGELRGRKGQLYEGGIRAPLVARWPGTIPAGSTSRFVSGFQDFWPTVCEILDEDAPPHTDGVSYLSALRGGEVSAARPPLYWEAGGTQALRDGDWKLVRKVDKKGEVKAELFDLGEDPNEKNDLASTRPELLARMVELARSSRVPSAVFASTLDGES